MLSTVEPMTVVLTCKKLAYAMPGAGQAHTAFQGMCGTSRKLIADIVMNTGDFGTHPAAAGGGVKYSEFKQQCWNVIYSCKD